MDFRSLTNLIFPAVCLHCRKYLENGKVRSPICRECLQGIKINDTLFCGECGLRLSENRKVCHKNFPYLLGAAGDYEDPALKDLLHGLKFQLIKDAALPLSAVLINYAGRVGLPKKNFEVVPMPLGKRREKKRGFNQAKLIARIFADHFGMRVSENSLSRSRNTKPQSEIRDFSEKRKNIAGCFEVINPEWLRDWNVILIDDVTTSGSTFLEAARALKGAGVKRIIALAVAKA